MGKVEKVASKYWRKGDMSSCESVIRGIAIGQALPHCTLWTVKNPHLEQGPQLGVWHTDFAFLTHGPVAQPAPCLLSLPQLSASGLSALVSLCPQSICPSLSAFPSILSCVQLPRPPVPPHPSQLGAGLVIPHPSPTQGSSASFPLALSDVLLRQKAIAHLRNLTLLRINPTCGAVQSIPAGYQAILSFLRDFHRWPHSITSTLYFYLDPDCLFTFLALASFWFIFVIYFLSRGMNLKTIK